MTALRDPRRTQAAREVHLDRVQIVWLTLGIIVTVGVAFALGVVVGRRAERQGLAPVAVADPVSEADAASVMHKELTFYDKLRDPRGAPPAPEPAAKKTEPKVANDAPSAGATSPAPQAGAELAASKRALETGQYTVQVSAFQSEGEAKAYASSLERKGYRPFVVEAEIPGRGRWYRVRVGSFDELTAANEAKQILARAAIPGWVIRVE